MSDVVTRRANNKGVCARKGQLDQQDTIRNMKKDLEKYTCVLSYKQAPSSITSLEYENALRCSSAKECFVAPRKTYNQFAEAINNMERQDAT